MLCQIRIKICIMHLNEIEQSCQMKDCTHRCKLDSSPRKKSFVSRDSNATNF